MKVTIDAENSLGDAIRDRLEMFRESAKDCTTYAEFDELRADLDRDLAETLLDLFRIEWKYEEGVTL